jgi:hypothetical protein
MGELPDIKELVVSDKGGQLNVKYVYTLEGRKGEQGGGKPPTPTFHLGTDPADYDRVHDLRLDIARELAKERPDLAGQEAILSIPAPPFHSPTEFMEYQPVKVRL